MIGIGCLRKTTRRGCITRQPASRDIREIAFAVRSSAAIGSKTMPAIITLSTVWIQTMQNFPPVRQTIKVRVLVTLRPNAAWALIIPHLFNKAGVGPTKWQQILLHGN